VSAPRRRLRTLAALSLLGGAASVLASSCTGEDTEATVRSLERTGKVAFVCLGQPGSDAALRPLSDCSNERRQDPNDFGADDSAAHLYAIVTLETRGELAVVDITSKTENVLDHDPSTPGDNPLPVGAQPVDVVATPKGTAVFAASAENGRPALFAISSEVLRPCEVDSSRCEDPAPTLSSFPSCRLPSAPGAMQLVADPPDEEGNVRPGCAEDYAPVDGDGPTFGDIDREGLGRQKLFVTLPREGRIVSIDAQWLLSQPAGAFADCELEADLALETSFSGPPAPPEVEPAEGCAVPESPAPAPISGSGRAIPGGVALIEPEGGTPGASGAKLFISDLALPVVHVLDLADVCAPVESAPLYPTSREDSTRVVVTDRVAVSRLTPAGNRYLYAIDIEDKSLMAFDVSPGSTSNVPLVVPNPEHNPFQPPDRIRFAAAPVDVTIVQRDLPEDAGSGVAPIGTLCDPDPEADVCAGSADCDLGTQYRTSSDYETGAGPLTLRGVYALVALASGSVAIIDIEDFDAPCRGPANPGAGFGCEETATGLVTTDEPSCNVVLPHQARSAYYLLTNDDVGRHLPGVQTFPILSLDDGTVVVDGPAMRAPAELTDYPVAVGGDLLTIPSTGAIEDDEGLRNTLALNFENPRVHQTEQEWALVYQGALPDFQGHVGDLALSDGFFSDATAVFCDRGVQPREAVRERLAAEGLTGAELEAAADRFADRLHVAEPLAESGSPYWEAASCTFADCRATFGDATVPTLARDLIILEAYQGRLDIAPPETTSLELMECCFPSLVDYEVRAGDEWVLIGGSSGFLHNVIATPATSGDAGGQCRPSCDPRVARRRGRAAYALGATDVAPPADAPLFKNALFTFTVVVPEGEDGAPRLERDMAFRFFSQAPFSPLRAPLAAGDGISVQVQSLGYLPMTDEVFATDGGLEGLLFLPGDLVGSIRQFY
jgi:hypothetical protein